MSFGAALRCAGAVVAGIGLMVGCSGDSTGGPACEVSILRDTIAVDAPPAKLDVLFVVDGSPSMEEEQASVATELPRLIRILASGDGDGDGTRDFEPVRDLRVGVVTADMGSGGHDVAFADAGTGDASACPDVALGDDGRLREEGAAATGCMAAYPRFLDFRSGAGVDAESFAQDVSCVVRVGTGGCGFEQPLEAVLKALTPSTSDLRFAAETVGHGDGANDGFPRSDVTLAVIVVSDEDDCSAADPALFDPESAYAGEPGTRCALNPEALHDVERFVDGLLALKEPHRLGFAVVAGVPPETVEEPYAISYGEILAHPDMEQEVDPASAGRLRPSCENGESGSAFPPRRLVTAVQRLGERGASTTVTSICEADWRPVLEMIRLQEPWPLTGLCPSRHLTPDADGLVDCTVTELLPAEGDFSTCEALAGRELLEVDEATGRQVCRVQQLPAWDGTLPDGSGWFYDGGSAAATVRCEDGPRITYSRGDEPRYGTVVTYRCVQQGTGTGTCG